MPQLLAWLCEEMERYPPAATLERLAAADRGEDFETNLVAIEEIVAGDRAPLRPFQYPLYEVFALTRWTRPDPAARSGNLTALFASLVMLVAQRDPDNRGYSDDFDSTLLMAVDMVIVAFPERVGAMLALLEGLGDYDADADEEAFRALGRFLLLEAAGADAASLLDSIATAIGHLRRRDADPLLEPSAQVNGRRYGWLHGWGHGASVDRWCEQLDAAASRLRARLPEVAGALESLATCQGANQMGDVQARS